MKLRISKAQLDLLGIIGLEGAETWEEVLEAWEDLRGPKLRHNFDMVVAALNQRELIVRGSEAGPFGRGRIMLTDRGRVTLGIRP